MRRTERLFQIIQILRSRRTAVTGQALAEELSVSTRTLYRDMAELSAQRVPIRGEAGVGYLIDRDFDMPPLMLTADELEAAVLGASWVAQRGDPSLVRAARDLVAKLTAAAPERLRPVILDSGLKVFAGATKPQDGFDVGLVRTAIRDAHKLEIAYRDETGAGTHRRIWPVALAYSDAFRLLAAWCELRGGFRHFRIDRIQSLIRLEEATPVSTLRLRREWKRSLAHGRRAAAEPDD